MDSRRTRLRALPAIAIEGDLVRNDESSRNGSTSKRSGVKASSAKRSGARPSSAAGPRLVRTKKQVRAEPKADPTPVRDVELVFPERDGSGADGEQLPLSELIWQAPEDDEPVPEAGPLAVREMTKAEQMPPLSVDTTWPPPLAEPEPPAEVPSPAESQPPSAAEVAAAPEPEPAPVVAPAETAKPAAEAAPVPEPTAIWEVFLSEEGAPQPAAEAAPVAGPEAAPDIPAAEETSLQAVAEAAPVPEPEPIQEVPAAEETPPQPVVAEPAPEPEPETPAADETSPQPVAVEPAPVVEPEPVPVRKFRSAKKARPQPAAAAAPAAQPKPARAIAPPEQAKPRPAADAPPVAEPEPAPETTRPTRSRSRRRALDPAPPAPARRFTRATPPTPKPESATPVRRPGPIRGTAAPEPEPDSVAVAQPGWPALGEFATTKAATAAPEVQEPAPEDTFRPYRPVYERHIVRAGGIIPRSDEPDRYDRPMIDTTRTETADLARRLARLGGDRFAPIAHPAPDPDADEEG